MVLPETVATVPGRLGNDTPAPGVTDTRPAKVSPAGSCSVTCTSIVPLVSEPSGSVTTMVTGRVSPITTVRDGNAASALSSAGTLDAPIDLLSEGGVVPTVSVSLMVAAVPPTGVPPDTKPSPAATPPAREA